MSDRNMGVESKVGVMGAEQGEGFHVDYLEPAKSPEMTFLENELDRVATTSVPFNLGELDALLTADSKESRAMAGTALGLRINDLYHRLHVESVAVLDSETGVMGMVPPHIEKHLPNHLKIDKSGVGRQAGLVANAVTDLVAYEKLMSLVRSGRITQDQLHTEYAGMTEGSLEGKIADLREGLKRSSQRLYDGLTGRQMSVEVTRVQQGEKQKLSARPGATILPEYVNDELKSVWVLPADRPDLMPRSIASIAQDERSEKVRRTVKKVASVGTLVVTASCTVLPAMTPTESPINSTDIVTEEPTEEPTKVVELAKPVLTTATPDTGESPTQEPSSDFVPANNPPEYTSANSGGPVSEYWKESAEINGAWARYSVQRSKGQFIDPVLSTEAFIEQMSVVNAKVYQVESPDGTQMVSVAVTEDGGNNQTMYIGVDRNTRLPFARPDGWMFNPDNSDVVAVVLPQGTVYGGQFGEDGNYYSYAVDPETGVATHWFNTTDGEGKWVELVVEKVYTSGVDQELLAEVIVEATEAIKAKGETFTNAQGEVVPVETIADKIQLEIQRGNYDQTVVMDKGSGNYTSDMLVLGTEEIDISTLPGGEPGDIAINVYGAQQNNEDVAVPMTVGYIRGGVFYPITDFWLGALEGKTVTFGGTLDEYKAIMDKYLQPGIVMRADVQTFSSVNTEGELRTLSEKRFVLGRYIDSVLKLLRLQDTDYIGRLNELSIVKAAEQLDPEMGDVGLFGRTIIVKVKK